MENKSVSFDLIDKLSLSLSPCASKIYSFKNQLIYFGLCMHDVNVCVDIPGK